MTQGRTRSWRRGAELGAPPPGQELQVAMGEDGTATTAGGRRPCPLPSSREEREIQPAMAAARSTPGRGDRRQSHGTTMLFVKAGRQTNARTPGRVTHQTSLTSSVMDQRIPLGHAQRWSSYACETARAIPAKAEMEEQRQKVIHLLLICSYCCSNPRAGCHDCCFFSDKLFMLVSL